MDLKRPRKLNLNAPLLSTRRLGYYSGVAADTSCSSNYSLSITAQNTSDQRVPFSWEKAPGKPKDSTQEANEEADDDDDAEDNNSCGVAFHDHQENHHGCDGGDDNNDDDAFSDAMDVFSLSEALDILQRKSEKAHSDNNNNNEGLLRLKIEESNGYQSPTYMINRFLPDATALAASSALHFHSNNFDSGNKVCDTCSYQECCYLSGSAKHSSYDSSSPKGYCGLELLFPWRLKHKLCSMKRPVLPCSKNLRKHNKRSSNKQKKHLPWSRTNVKGEI